MAVRLYLIPFVLGVFLPVLFTITYVIALLMSHINPFIPYISDTGTVAPELCVFALGLSIGMILVSTFAYIRYRQVDTVLKIIEAEQENNNELNSLRRINHIGLYVGYLAGIGMTIVGSFQETNLLSVHIFGAALAFAGASIYFTIQGYLTRNMAPGYSSALIGTVQIAAGATGLVLYIICQSTGLASLNEFKGTNILKWESKDGAWDLRITSTATEWLLLVILQLTFFTFIPGFKRISLSSPQCHIRPLIERDSNIPTVPAVHSVHSVRSVCVVVYEVTEEQGAVELLVTDPTKIAKTQK